MKVKLDRLNVEVLDLLEGKGGIDRSQVIHRLLVKVINTGYSLHDALEMMKHNKALWQYCLDHRDNDEMAALTFAKAEIGRALLCSDKREEKNES